MYEMFTGRPPYTGDNPTTILYQHLEGKAPPPRELNPNLIPELQTIIQKAMAVDPAQRFQSMEALGKNLIPLLKQAAAEGRTYEHSPCNTSDGGLRALRSRLAA